MINCVCQQTKTKINVRKLYFSASPVPRTGHLKSPTNCFILDHRQQANCLLSIIHHLNKWNIGTLQINIGLGLSFKVFRSLRCTSPLVWLKQTKDQKLTSPNPQTLSSYRQKNNRKTESKVRNCLLWPFGEPWVNGQRHMVQHKCRS